VTTITQRHVFTKGPRMGLVEIRNAHKHADGFYRVYSPEGIVGSDGKRRKNIKENAKFLTNLDDVADYVDKGWGVRMTGPYTPVPSLCSKDVEVMR